MELEQNTNEWLEWRKQGIGGSDVPIIMGVSPYKTRFQLWQEKTGAVIPEKMPNFVQQKSHEKEVIARNKYEIETGLSWEPRLAQFAGNEIMRASLDGYNEELNATWECKFVGKEIFEKVKKGYYVPEHYYPQVQYQMLVTGAKECHFYCINEENETAFCIVKEDKDYQHQIFEQVELFWDLIRKNKPPKLTSDDVVKVEDEAMLDLFISYKINAKLEKQYKEKCEEIKKEIFKAIPHCNVECYGMKASIYEREGNIQWKKIPEIAALDSEYLDKFRAKSSKVKQIRIPKEKDE